jgi:hypothetical protein
MNLSFAVSVVRLGTVGLDDGLTCLQVQVVTHNLLTGLDSPSQTGL